MDNEMVRRLRRKQQLYSNFFLMVYLVLVIGIIVLVPITRGDIYKLLGVSLFCSIIGQMMLYRMKGVLGNSYLQQLHQWEREKLGESWFKYILPGMVLRVVLTIYFFLQAWLHAGITPFHSEVPYWYFVLIPIIFILVTNLHMLLHARRVDTRTQSELESYCQEKMLFTTIFATVASFMALIGFVLVYLLR